MREIQQAVEKLARSIAEMHQVGEGNESVTNCNQLKLVSPKDGKRYKTDVADPEQLFRIIQSERHAVPFERASALLNLEL